MGVFRGYCLGCEKRKTCTEPCKEVEQYINQDNTKQRIPIVKVQDIEQLPGEDQVEVFTFRNTALAAFKRKLSPREMQVATKLMEGQKKSRICQDLKITRRTLRTYLKRIKQKLI